MPRANLPRKAERGGTELFPGMTVHGVDRIEEAMDLARSLA